MKNRIVVLLLASLVGVIEANVPCAVAAQPRVCSSAESNSGINEVRCQASILSEANMRQKLYLLDASNPRYYLIKDFPFDYYIAVLKDHIKVLEDKIALNEDGAKSSAARKFGVSAGITALCGGMGVYSFYNTIESLDKMLIMVSCGGFSVLFGLLTKDYFHKALSYAERLVQRLERDKRILAILQAEKAAQQANNIAQEAAAQVIEAVKTVLNDIEGFFKPKAA